MPRRAYRAERGVTLATLHRRDRGETGTGSATRDIPRLRPGVGVGIESTTASGSDLLDPAQVRLRMDAQQILDAGQCWLDGHEVFCEVALATDAVDDCAEPLGALGMPRTRQMVEKGGVRCEQHSHDSDAIHYRRGRVKQLIRPLRRAPTESRSLYGHHGVCRVAPWTGDPATALLTIYHQTSAPAPADLARWLRALTDDGYQRVRTGALPDTMQSLLHDFGFVARQRLTLLRTDGVMSIPRHERAGVRHTARPPLDVLSEIDAQCFAEPWQLGTAAMTDVLRATPLATTAIVGGRQPLGFALAGHDRRTGYLQRLAVHPDARRHGIGRRLVMDFLRWSARHGARQTLVNTHVENEAALALYRQCGFVAAPGELVVFERSLP
jgi:ribosomal protein S18 acetylase RimI-like enzyme